MGFGDAPPVEVKEKKLENMSLSKSETMSMIFKYAEKNPDFKEKLYNGFIQDIYNAGDLQKIVIDSLKEKGIELATTEQGIRLGNNVNFEDAGIKFDVKK